MRYQPSTSIRSLVLVLLALLFVPTLAAAGETLDAQVSLLIGFPSADETASKGVLVVPGTVIPLSAGTGKPMPGVAREEVASARLISVAENLKDTLRLAKVEVSYRQPLTFELNAGRDLPPPAADSDLRIHIKLLGFNDRSASFEVQLYEHSTPIADSKVTVVRGQRAVVGAPDGEDAPYLFLVIEPEATGPQLESPDGPLYGDLTSPRVIEKIAPSYTEEARKNRTMGTVIVRTIIAEDGSIEDVEVLKGQPDGLSEAAVAAVRQWRFEPATLDGKPVSVYYNLTINFRLAKEKKAAEKAPEG